MGVLGIILLVLFVIVALILIFLVVIQNENTQGLGGIFGGSSDTTFGSRSGNILTKITYTVGGLFLVLSFILAFINRTPESDILQRAGEDQQAQEWWAQPAEDEQEGEPAEEMESLDEPMLELDEPIDELQLD